MQLSLLLFLGGGSTLGFDERCDEQLEDMQGLFLLRFSGFSPSRARQ